MHRRFRTVCNACEIENGFDLRRSPSVLSPFFGSKLPNSWLPLPPVFIFCGINSLDGRSRFVPDENLFISLGVLRRQSEKEPRDGLRIVLTSPKGTFPIQSCMKVHRLVPPFINTRRPCEASVPFRYWTKLVVFRPLQSYRGLSSRVWIGIRQGVVSIQA